MDSGKRVVSNPARPALSYAWLAFDGLRLLLPQAEIRMLEPILDIEMTEPPRQGVGWLFFAGRYWPVHCLTRALELVPELPVERRICAVLASSGNFLGLACEEVRLVDSKALRLHPVPKCMQQRERPAAALAIIDSEIVIVSTVPRLVGFLGIDLPSRSAQSDSIKELA